MTPDDRYDMVVIGSGPGGQKAAVQGAKAGRRVALIERERHLGGAGVLQGTIPSKILREAALAILQLKRSAAGFNMTPREDLEVSSLLQRLDCVLKAHTRFISDHILGQGIERIHGRARLTGRFEVEVVGSKGQARKLAAEHIVVATGSRPRTPPNLPVDHEHILDSDSILSMIYLPRSLVVLGGGVIASEYASIFSALGVKVTMVDQAPRPLMFLERELTDKFLSHFQRHGGRYLSQMQVKSVRWDGVSQVVTDLESGEQLKSDKMLVAQGRSANVEGLDLDKAGVEMTPRGVVAVNEFYQTTAPNIYAVGDVIGWPALAASSMEQGRRAVCHALKLDLGHPIDLAPWGIYTVPEMASVGLTEEKARARLGEVVVGRAPLDAVPRGQIAGMEDGLLKVVADARDRKLLGVQIVGHGASDLIQVGEMALLNGNDLEVFTDNLFSFPTLGEAYRVASLDALQACRGRASQPLRLAA